MRGLTDEDVREVIRRCYERNRYPWVETWEIEAEIAAPDYAIERRLESLAGSGGIACKGIEGEIVWYLEDGAGQSSRAASPSSESQ